ncbi:DUF192 domain-containing protein [Corticibacter populi]|uniref:DUF192 domain-containing protein n=1 Tax=Corticibacter populi TaxID=1550736 RepID=A0A3M6QP76_9BURK|nr:DUF192 domain-containing protein [Corticibacter populi]RMX04870.1 DUF192 domain-containing protein [Corticibacter populi]RZS33707.1 hypothetical protein EV687_2034 [Corticibacter populi]
MSTYCFDHQLLINERDSGYRVGMARRFHQRAAGLLFGRPLRAGEALWIGQCGSIHTVGMRYAIDVVFLDRNDHVVRVAGNVPPWRFRIARHSASVLEMPAGQARAAGLHAGDRVQIMPACPSSS